MVQKQTQEPTQLRHLISIYNLPEWFMGMCLLAWTLQFSARQGHPSTCQPPESPYGMLDQEPKVTPASNWLPIRNVVFVFLE